MGVSLLGGGWKLGVRKKKWENFNLLYGCRWVTPPDFVAGLLSMLQGQVLLPGTPEDVYFSFFSFFSRQCCTDEAAYINPVYSPLFLLNYSFLPAVTGERIDCALSLILWFSCHFEVRDQNRDGTQQWQWSASTYQKLQKPSVKRPSATHTQSSSWPSSPTLWWQTRWRHNSFWDWNPFLIDGAIYGQVHRCNLCSRRLQCCRFVLC